jgi:hypothetical protein
MIQGTWIWPWLVDHVSKRTFERDRHRVSSGEGRIPASDEMPFIGLFRDPSGKLKVPIRTTIAPKMEIASECRARKGSKAINVEPNGFRYDSEFENSIPKLSDMESSSFRSKA